MCEVSPITLSLSVSLNRVDMGKVGVNNDGPVTKEFAGLDCRVQDENKKTKDGAIGGGQGLSREVVFQANVDVQDVNNWRSGAVQAQVLTQSGQQRSEKQLQGSSVCWEEFLSVRSLKVLLVETDDSTRSIVSALLRNCGYEVITVADGIQAWKILQDPTTRVDLVLSEVVMPCLSGIDLLTRIMDHKTCKNIPVIMMSSIDSMSTVLNCLSKGAVDFLVKPIRKNELKNLWQHVWRKCHNTSASGGGSESGIRTQRSSKSTSVEESDKSGSNYQDNIGSIGLNAGDEGDNGSGTEINQVLHSRPEAFGNGGVHAIETRKCAEQDEELDVVALGKNLGIGVPRIPNLQLEEPKEKWLTNMADTNKDKLSEMDSMKDYKQLEKGQAELNNEEPNQKLRNQVVDLMGDTTNSTADPQMRSVMFDVPNGVSKVSDIKDKAIHDSKEIPSLELSLMTQRDVQDFGFRDHDRNVLRHSDHSAFSRYMFTTTSKQSAYGRVHSPLDNSLGAEKAKPFLNFQSHTNSSQHYQHSRGFSNNNDMDSTTHNFFSDEKACENKAEPRSTIRGLHISSAFQSEHDRIISVPQPIIQDKADAAICSPTLSQEWDMNQQVQAQEHHNHLQNVPQHHHHYQQIPNPDDLSLKNLAAAAAPQSGSSNGQGSPMEGNVGNHSLHGSASGSNHSSNGQSGGSSTINSRGTNMESDKGVDRQEGTINATGVGGKSGVDQNHLTQREAALNRFRQKRKDRCFEKKVRYQNRKKLADQRPRVRGQFVRQVVHENKGNDTTDS